MRIGAQAPRDSQLGLRSRKLRPCEFKVERGDLKTSERPKAQQNVVLGVF